ncbi:MAG TPA: SRPBCC domain-containing protein [Anaerolineae bacterium]|nr:SRPBCC domain-containing protein [Anaerolineae bacterium]
MTQLRNIQLEQFIHHSPARVWQALTDPALLARWWAAGDVRPVVGHRFTLDMGAPFGQQPCEVLAVEPNRLFSYAFASGTLNTIVTWRLEPEGNGTRLFLEHAGFDLDSPIGPMAFNGMGAGWPAILTRIEPLLSTSAHV